MRRKLLLLSACFVFVFIFEAPVTPHYKASFNNKTIKEHKNEQKTGHSKCHAKTERESKKENKKAEKKQKVSKKVQIQKRAKEAKEENNS